MLKLDKINSIQISTAIADITISQTTIAIGKHLYTWEAFMHKFNLGNRRDGKVRFIDGVPYVPSGPFADWDNEDDTIGYRKEDKI